MKLKKLVAVSLVAALAVSSMFAAKAKKQKKAKKGHAASVRPEPGSNSPLSEKFIASLYRYRV